MRRVAIAVLLISLVGAVAGAQTNDRVGTMVRDGAPRPPAFPLSNEDCAAYAEALSRFQSEMGAKHQACLNTATTECPDDQATGCTCHTCAPFHGSVSTADVGACYRAVSESEERIQRVNQTLREVGSSSGELLTRQFIGRVLKDAAGSSQVAQALGQVSALVHRADTLRRLLTAFQSDTANELPSAPRHLADILQELSRRGLSKNPVALLLTDVALGLVAQTQSDALRELDAQLSKMTRNLGSTPGSNTIGNVDCSLLRNEQANRDLMQRDPSRWLSLVQQCNPK